MDRPSGEVMPCYHPLYLRERQVTVGCGRCIGCRLEYARQWSVRCMHEASLNECNSFVTLTYSDERLPPYGSLVKAHVSSFMKRLREAYAPRKVRFFASGEYGERSKRPHYHILLFGCDFADKVAYAKRGEFLVYRSDLLSTLWVDGLHEIGSVTVQSAGYVARYVVKKARAGKGAPVDVDAETGEVLHLEPEFALMSRRPGIGRPWLDKYMCEVYPSDSVVVRGRLGKPPRYYDVQYELQNPASMALIKSKRQVARQLSEETPRRLRARETVAAANPNWKERSL